MSKKLLLVILAALIAVPLALYAAAAVSEKPESKKITAAACPAVLAARAGQAGRAAAPPAAAPGAAYTGLPGTAPAPAPYPGTPRPAPAPTPPGAPAPGKAVIVFTFDDGPLSDYLLAYPILKRYGIKGTSYIITGFVDAKTKGKLNWEQIKEMSEYGWAFGAHTNSHQRMAGLEGDEIKADCEAVKQSFTNQGFKAPEIAAYPYGSYSKEVIQAIKPYYRQSRLAYYRNDFVDPGGNPYKIACISADMRTNSALKKRKK